MIDQPKVNPCLGFKVKPYLGFKVNPYLGFKVKYTLEEREARKKYLEDYRVKIQQLKRV